MDIYSTFDIQQVQSDGSSYQYIVLVFKCVAEISEVQLSSEHQQFLWVEPNKGSHLPMKTGYRALMDRLAN